LNSLFIPSAPDTPNGREDFLPTTNCKQNIEMPAKIGSNMPATHPAIRMGDHMPCLKPRRLERRIILATVVTFLAALLAATAKLPAQAYPHAPPWVADQTLYEVNLRSFSPEANLEGFRNQLPRLRELGVGTLWFMPVYPIGSANHAGRLGSPYAVKNYRDFNPEFGTLADFKSVIDQAHRMGMFVIIDWVGNHTALDHPWVTQHPDWYKHDSTGQFLHPMPTWQDVYALNYQSADLRKEMIDSMSFWVRDVGVDGFRCDAAEMLPLDFWAQARDALRKIKPVFMLAEGVKPELVSYAFDAAYAWDLSGNMENIVKGTKTVPDLINYLKADARILPTGKFRLNFLTNHDKNAFQGTTREVFGPAADAFTVLTFTVPGMPLIYNGQETGAEHRLNLFDRDPIVWRDDPEAKLYSALARLKRSNSALWDSVPSAPMQFIDSGGGNSVFVFEREAAGDRIVVALNLEGQPAKIQIPSAATQLQTVLGDGSEPDQNGQLTLGPWGYRVWANTR
jgi:cyclomaltodextrinase / maltogenic alpha-amylase / neopullulanase